MTGLAKVGVLAVKIEAGVSYLPEGRGVGVSMAIPLETLFAQENPRQTFLDTLAAAAEMVWDSANKSLGETVENGN